MTLGTTGSSPFLALKSSLPCVGEQQHPALVPAKSLPRSFCADPPQKYPPLFIGLAKMYLYVVRLLRGWGKGGAGCLGGGGGRPRLIHDSLPVNDLLRVANRDVICIAPAHIVASPPPRYAGALGKVLLLSWFVSIHPSSVFLLFHSHSPSLTLIHSFSHRRQHSLTHSLTQEIT